MAQDQQLNTPQVPSPKWLLALALIMFMGIPMVTGTLLSWHSLGELDVWLHQKAGQEIIQGAGFPQLNSYSYTEPDHIWTNHEWLFQILVASTGPASGDLQSGINRWVILRLVLTLVLLSILLAGDIPWRATPLRLLWLTPGIFLGISLLWTRVLLRPELVSYALMILIVRFAEHSTCNTWSFRQLASPRSRELLAFGVTVVWAQFHGFSALAPVIWLLAGLLGYLPHSHFPRKSLGQLLAGTGLLLVALMLTPNGWQGLIYPLMALGQFSSSEVDLHKTISELQPLLETTGGLNLTILFFQISLCWGLVHTIVTWPRRNLLRTILWILAAAATLVAQRNIGIYAVTFVLLHTNARHHQYWNFRLKSSITPRLIIIPMVMVLLAAGWFWPALVNDDFYLGEGQSRRFGSGPTAARYPFQATEILARTPGTRVFANIDAAALSLSQGNALVFIDGRTEAYSPRTWGLYHQLRKAGAGSLKILDQSGTEKILLTLGRVSFQPLLLSLLESPDWEVQHADAAGVLLKRRDKKMPGSISKNLASFALPHPPKGKTPLSATRRADLQAAQGSFLILAGKLDEGVSCYLRGLALRPEHPLLNYNLGNQLLNNGQTTLALRHFQQALETNPRLLKSAMNAGVCMMKMKDFDGARKMFEKAVKLQPENYKAWSNLSLALQQLGRQGDAYYAMEKAVALKPGNTQLRKALQNLKSSR